MTTNIAIASTSPAGRALWRHLKSRRQFEQNFSYACVAVYSSEGDVHPDDKSTLLEKDLNSFVSADNVDVVVDTFNNVSQSYDVCWGALNAGKHVVTTNAAMVAIHGEKLSTLAEAHNLHFKFSGAVLGGVPIVQSLKNGAENWYISRVHGVLNSTCNYVLKRMKERHVTQKEALSAAVELGYTHPNPDMDVSGKDTLYKLALLSAVSYGVWPKIKEAQVVPLDDISLTDISLANQLGFDVCHIGVATAESLKVGPTLVEQQTLLSRMDGTLTGVVVDGEQIGSIFMAGYGADAHAITASIMSDISDIVSNTVKVYRTVKTQKRKHAERALPRYYVRLPEAEKSRLEKLTNADIIETALLKNRETTATMGMVIETAKTKTDLEAMLTEIKDDSVVLNIFRE